MAAGDPSFPRGTTLSLFDTIPKRSLANREKVGFCYRPGWEENGTIGMEHAVFWWSCFPEEARTFGGDCCRRNSPCDVHATCSADGSRKDARSGVDHTPDGDALVFHCCNHDDVFGYRGSASVGVQLHLCQVHRPLSLHVSAQASCWHHFRHDFLCWWSSSHELQQQWWWCALPTKCRKFFYHEFLWNAADSWSSFLLLPLFFCLWRCEPVADFWSPWMQ